MTSNRMEEAKILMKARANNANNIVIVNEEEEKHIVAMYLMKYRYVKLTIHHWLCFNISITIIQNSFT